MPRVQIDSFLASLGVNPIAGAGVCLELVNMHQRNGFPEKRQGSQILGTLTNSDGLSGRPAGVFALRTHPVQNRELIIIPYQYSARVLRFAVSDSLGGVFADATTVGGAVLEQAVSDSTLPLQGVGFHNFGVAAYRLPVLVLGNGVDFPIYFALAVDPDNPATNYFVAGTMPGQRPTSADNEAGYLKTLPVPRLLGMFENQLVIAERSRDTQADRLWFSDVGFHPSFKIIGYSNLANNSGSFLRAMVVHAGRVYLFNDDAIYRMGDEGSHSTTDSAGLQTVRYRDPEIVVSGIGAIGPQSVVAFAGAIWFLNKHGAYRFDGYNAVDITSGPLGSLFRSAVEGANMDLAVVVPNHKTNEVWFCFSAAAGSGDVFAYDTINQRWAFYEDKVVERAAPVLIDDQFELVTLRANMSSGAIANWTLALENRGYADNASVDGSGNFTGTKIHTRVRSEIMAPRPEYEKVLKSVSLVAEAGGLQSVYVSVGNEDETDAMLAFDGDVVRRWLDVNSDQYREYPVQAFFVHAFTFVVSGETATWTDVSTKLNWDRPNEALSLDLSGFPAGAGDYLYLDLGGAMRGVLFDIKEPVATYKNANAATVTIQYYDGMQWRTFANIVDNTLGPSATPTNALHYSNVITWDMPERWNLITMNGWLGPWIRVRWSAALSAGCTLKHVAAIGLSVAQDATGQATNQVTDDNAATDPDIEDQDATNALYLGKAIIPGSGARRLRDPFVMPPLVFGGASVCVETNSVSPFRILRGSLDFSISGKGPQ